MYVLTWDRKIGLGGHQLVMDHEKAERMRNHLARARPEWMVRVIPADVHAAEAVEERRPAPARPRR